MWMGMEGLWEITHMLGCYWGGNYQSSRYYLTFWKELALMPPFWSPAVVCSRVGPQEVVSGGV